VFLPSQSDVLAASGRLRIPCGHPAPPWRASAAFSGAISPTASKAAMRSRSRRGERALVDHEDGLREGSTHLPGALARVGVALDVDRAVPGRQDQRHGVPLSGGERSVVEVGARATWLRRMERSIIPSAVRQARTGSSIGI
ncbi:MAG: hypothetical protein OXC54_01080, partial [Rhodospirillaceae bacterium]|nr:hypothetical protein [Rhodospirillaceae bacterium]